MAPTHSMALVGRRAAAWTAALIIVLAFAGCGRAEQAASYETKDDYQVSFATEPSPPKVGDGTVIVTLLDANGQPVDGARVSLEANMNHAGMVPVYADISSGDAGVYRTPLKWTMGGEWYVDANITLRGGEVVRRRFPVDIK
jgi:hypothetical protein